MLIWENMKLSNNKKRKSLSIEEIETFFETHLPYRLAMLNTFNNNIWNDYEFRMSQDYIKLRICAVESSRIAGRFFIQFMGLKVERGVLISTTKVNSDDVHLCDLGGTNINPLTLNESDKETLIKVYLTGNKSTAHITFDSSKNTGYPNVLDAGAKLINKLLKDNLYDIVCKEMKTL
jgi:hypothetical protein